MATFLCGFFISTIFCRTCIILWAASKLPVLMALARKEAAGRERGREGGIEGERWREGTVV